MILSHRWRFIFIKGRKVAGTSVEMALSTICGDDDIITRITPRDEVARVRLGGRGCQNYAVDAAEERRFADAVARIIAENDDRFDQLRASIPTRQRFYNHMSLREIRDNVPLGMAGYRIFGIERSPYSKAISLANMHATYAAYEAGHAMATGIETMLSMMDSLIADGQILQARNIDLYRDTDGEVAATILRYSHLRSDLESFLREMGAPMPSLPHAKKGLLADRLDHLAILGSHRINKLNEMFADEFAAFGYPMLITS